MMDYKYIEQLLERYWNGETSLEEEGILRAFFAQKDVPEVLRPYQSLFVYQRQETSQKMLGIDFDRRLLSMIEEEEPATATTKRVTLTQRLMPLFRAAAVVAIFLTLGNAAQESFEAPQNPPVGQAGYNKVEKGASVAMGDSAVADTLQKAVFQAVPGSIIK